MYYWNREHHENNFVGLPHQNFFYDESNFKPTSFGNSQIYFLVLRDIFQSASQSQQYLQIGFAADNNLPTVDSSGEFVLLTFSDGSLNNIFDDYSITIYKKEFPSVTFFNHPLVPKLNRVYKIKTTSNIASLYSALVSYNPSSILTLYLLNDVDTLLYTPNDYVSDFFPCNYCTHSPSTYALKQLELIKARDAWDITTGSSNIRIGISDINFYLNHEDLVDQFVNVHPGAITNLGGHGTIVAGIAAAETNNGIGISSIGFNSKLVALPVNYNALLDAVYTYQCKVINCSWGSCFPVSTQQEIINIINDAGVTVVAAAGNGNLTNTCGAATALVYPASYDNVISVTSVGHVYDLSETQNCPGNLSYYGNNKDVHNLTPTQGGIPATYYHQHNDKVDICAPGYDVTSTRSSTLSYHNCEQSGTSYAAPFVAGTAALIYSIKETFQPDEIEACIKCTAFDVYSLSQNSAYVGLLGAGRLDAHAALQKAQNLIAKKPVDIIWSYDDANTLRRIECDPNDIGILMDNDEILNNTIYCEAIPSSSTPSISSFQWIIKSLGLANTIRKTGNPISIQIPNDFGAQGASCYISVNARNDVPSLCNTNASSFYGENGDLAITGMTCPPYPAPLGIPNRLVNKETDLDESVKTHFKIYPNPAKKELILEIPDNVTFKNGIVIEFTTSTGQIVKTITAFSKNSRVNVSNFKSGIYWVTILAKNKRITKSVIIQ